MQKSTLILGIGNYDRQDDGVAWHILCGIAKKLGRIIPGDPYSEGFPLTGEYPHLLFDLQLLPEMVDILKQYDQVYFVDAHTGAIPEELQVIPIAPQFEHSPLTHHMNPQSLLSLAETVNGTFPQAVLISVRGYLFGFEHSISPRTSELAQEAIQKLMDWVTEIA